MKKIYLLFMISLLIFSYGCSQAEKKVSTENKTLNAQEQKKEEEKKEESKKEEDKKDDAKESIKKEEETKDKEVKNAEIKEVSILYFDENTNIVFDNSINSEEFKEYLNKESKEKPEGNTSYKVKIQDGKIVSFERKDKLEVMGTYIGLSDANVAEFSYNSNAFRLEITPEQSEKLEEIPENQLLSLEIEKSKNEGGNFKLTNFSTK